MKHELVLIELGCERDWL